MSKKLFFGLCILCSTIIWATATHASALILISEILADPAAGIAGDADGNGTRSSSGDEFVEIFHSGEDAIDLTGWRLRDAVALRHVFSGAINPKTYLAIFGSTASSGGLSLNNSGDIISLYDNHDQLIDQVTYGALANQNQSIVRVGEEWMLHSEAAEGLFSPGAPHSAAVPEPISAVTFALGGLSALACRKKTS